MTQDDQAEVMMDNFADHIIKLFTSAPIGSISPITSSVKFPANNLLQNYFSTQKGNIAVCIAIVL